MSIGIKVKAESNFVFVADGNIIFTIKADGTVERGPTFTTVDEMSLKFWEAVENTRRPLTPIYDYKSTFAYSEGEAGMILNKAKRLTD